MNYFNVCHLVRSLDSLDEVAARCDAVLENPLFQEVRVRKSVPIPPDLRDSVKRHIDYLRGKCEASELTTALRRIDGPIFLGLRDGITFETLQNQIKELKQDVRNDLEYRRFVFIPSEKAAILTAIGHRWAEVWKVLPECVSDSRDAVECYALGKNSACVFHLMRVAEHGLRSIAKKLSVKLTHKKANHPIEYADWEKVIDGIRQRITNARIKPHGPVLWSAPILDGVAKLTIAHILVQFSVLDSLS